MTARALLVPDCGIGVGLGHLERVLALADALAPDVTATVVVPADDPALQRRVSDRGHAAVNAGGDAGSRAVSAAARAVPDVIVVDGYVFDVATQQQLRDRAPLIVVDDLGLPAACDLAVNPSPGGEAMRPSGADSFLGGAAYALLPATVLAARRAVPRHSRGRRSVLVSTGATDRLGITARVAGELLRGDPTVEVVAVIGPEMRRDDLPGHPRLHVLLQPSEVATPLASAMVYCGAAGTTAVQAACVGIPAVITAVVNNQENQAAALAAAGCALVTTPTGLAAECLRLLGDAARCGRMGRAGRELVDGEGAARVAESVRRLVRAPAA